MAGTCSTFIESAACARQTLCLRTRSGPLPSAQNYSAPFFSGLMGFNASHNRLSGTIPIDWARTAFFDATGPLRILYFDMLGSDPAFVALRKQYFFFDVRSNALTGMLPSFFQSSAPPVVDSVRTEVRRQKPKEDQQTQHHVMITAKERMCANKALAWSGTALRHAAMFVFSQRTRAWCSAMHPEVRLPKMKGTFDIPNTRAHCATYPVPVLLFLYPHTACLWRRVGQGRAVHTKVRRQNWRRMTGKSNSN